MQIESTSHKNGQNGIEHDDPKMSTPTKADGCNIHQGKECYGTDAELMETRSLTRNALKDIVTSGKKSALKDQYFVLQAIEVKQF